MTAPRPAHEEHHRKHAESLEQALRVAQMHTVSLEQELQAAKKLQTEHFKILQSAVEKTTKTVLLQSPKQQTPNLLRSFASPLATIEPMAPSVPPDRRGGTHSFASPALAAQLASRRASPKAELRQPAIMTPTARRMAEVQAAGRQCGKSPEGAGGLAEPQHRGGLASSPFGSSSPVMDKVKKEFAGHQVGFSQTPRFPAELPQHCFQSW